MSYQGKLLQADKLTYDKLNKQISAKDNILLLFGDQFFKVSELEYSFITNQGYLIDVQGFISTNTLMDDLSSNFSVSDSNKIESLLKLEKIINKDLHLDSDIEKGRRIQSLIDRAQDAYIKQNEEGIARNKEDIENLKRGN